MDDQAWRQLKKTDHTMVKAFAKRWGNHSRLGLWIGLAFHPSRLQSVITTAPSLILPKDSWIGIWMPLTLISSLYFEALLMDWRVLAPSTLLWKAFSPQRLSLPKPTLETKTLSLLLNKQSNRWERLWLGGRTPSSVCPPSTNSRTSRNRSERKTRTTLLQLLSPAERVPALLASSSRPLTHFSRLLKRHSLGTSSVSIPMILSCRISLRGGAWKDKSRPLGWQR